LIYESPDGGKTVYSRRPGETERTLIHESTEVRARNRWAKFANILHLAETEPALDDAVKKVEMLYALLKDNDGS
jgi:hypothetical protein